jgi:hypothetical protein
MRILQADTLNETFCVRTAGRSTLSIKRREVAHGHFAVRGKKQKYDPNNDLPAKSYSANGHNIREFWA